MSIGPPAGGLSMTHYDTLGVDKSADAATIKRAYRKKSREHHPDRGGDTSQMIAVNRAFDTLRRSDSRFKRRTPEVERAMKSDVKQVIIVKWSCGKHNHVSEADAKRCIDGRGRGPGRPKKGSAELAKERIRVLTITKEWLVLYQKHIADGNGDKKSRGYASAVMASMCGISKRRVQQIVATTRDYTSDLPSVLVDHFRSNK
jgi:DnaJ domain